MDSWLGDLVQLSCAPLGPRRPEPHPAASTSSLMLQHKPPSPHTAVAAKLRMRSADPSGKGAACWHEIFPCSEWNMHVPLWKWDFEKIPCQHDVKFGMMFKTQTCIFKNLNYMHARKLEHACSNFWKCYKCENACYRCYRWQHEIFACQCQHEVFFRTWIFGKNLLLTWYFLMLTRDFLMSTWEFFPTCMFGKNLMSTCNTFFWWSESKAAGRSEGALVKSYDRERGAAQPAQSSRIAEGHELWPSFEWGHGAAPEGSASR